MTANISEYIGKSYPLMSYAAQQSVSDNTSQLPALLAEKNELTTIFADFIGSVAQQITLMQAQVARNWKEYSKSIGSSVDVYASPPYAPSAGWYSGLVQSSSFYSAEVKTFGNYGVENADEWEIFLSIMYSVSSSSVSGGPVRGFSYHYYRPYVKIFESDGPLPKAMLTITGGGSICLVTPTLHNKCATGDIVPNHFPSGKYK